MLYAKINPSAKVVKSQGSIFLDPEVISAEYMTALARPYGLGQSKTRFEVYFGTLEFDSENNPIGYNRLISKTLEFTTEDLKDWGSDDSVILEIIADKLSTKVEKTVSIDTDGVFL